MAEAVGKATGRPGVCFVTRGPGATNASPGIHIAQQDSTPMIMFVGQVGARHARARGVPGARLSRGVRHHDQMGDRDRRSGPHAGIRLARLLHRDQRPARAGGDRAARGHAGRTRRVAERAGVRAGRDLARRDRHDEAAEAAVGGGTPDRPARRQPLVGRRVRGDRALRRAFRAAGRDDLPPRPSDGCAASLLRRRSRHRPQSEAARARQSRRPGRAGRRPLGEMPSQGYTLFDIPGPQTTLVHVHPGAEELGRVYRPHLAIQCGADRVRRPCRRPAAADRHPLARGDQASPTPIISPGPRRRRRFPAASISARSWCGCATTCRPTR